MAMELRLIDKRQTKHDFQMAPIEAGGKLLSIQSAPWEPDDPQVPFRVALHPWAAGLAPSRISPRVTFSGDLRNRPAMVYAKSHGDASNANYFTAPPRMHELSQEIFTVFFNDEQELAYGGSAYGTYTYMGPASSTSAIFLGVRNFNGYAYFGGGQYLYKVDSDYNFTVIKDFGAGNEIAALEVFEDELVIALGDTDPLWVMNTSEVFTASADGSVAIALARVGSLIWRAKSGNLIQSCETDPEIDSNWVPAAGNEYTVGDNSYPVTQLVEFGGVVVPITPHGVWFPDASAEFFNQAPQMGDYPDPDNGKGTFRAKGFLFVPWIGGLLRIQLGESLPVGPELSGRPDFRFRVRAGVEWQQNIYVLCTDESERESTFVCMMMEDMEGLSGNPYIYHEWRRLNSTGKGYVILVYTEPENPTMFASVDLVLKYWKMGRGGGPDVEDPNYEFESVYELDTGRAIMAQDMGVRINLDGVKIVAKQPQDGTISAYYDVTRSGEWTPMSSKGDGTGVIPISDFGHFSAVRYTQPNSNRGHIVEVLISGTLPVGTLSEDRPEIEEVWAFGSVSPDVTDIITVGIVADKNSRIRFLRKGRKALDTLDILNEFLKTGEYLQLILPEYSDTVAWVKVVGVNFTNVNVSQEGNKLVQRGLIQLILRRVDFLGEIYAD